LRKTGLFFFVALALFGLAIWLNLETGILKFVIHNVFVFLFLGLIWFFEKKSIRSL
jgi:hypothetical protein